MKKFFILILLAGLIAPFSGYSQLDKGDLLGPFSLGISYYHQNNKEKGQPVSLKLNDVSVSLTDGLGIFVIDRLAVGPGLTFSLENYHGKFSSSSSSIESFNNFSWNILFSPFVRYYFSKSDKLAFFVQASGSIGYGQDIGKTKYPDQEESKLISNNLVYGGGAGVGMSYFFNENIALETMLAYYYQGKSSEYKESYNYKEIYNRNGVWLNVGLAFYLQPGK